MFAAHELTANVSFPIACTRLGSFIKDGWLGAASEEAYHDGFTAVIRVGPFGDRPAAAKRVRVRFLDPVSRGATMTVAVRWEATGITGTLFPVLDADIILTQAAEGATRLALTGTYRPPLDRLGATLDKLILHRVATATIRALLERIASALTAAPSPRTGDGTAPAPRP